MEDRTARRHRTVRPWRDRADGAPSGPAPRRRRLLRPGIAAALGLGTVALCVSIIRPAPAASQGSAYRSGPLLSVTVPTPSTTPATTAPPSPTIATTPRTSPVTTYRPRTTYTTRPSPTTGYSRSTAATDTTTTTVAPTTTTTVAPLGGGGILAPPSTLPLTTKEQSGHVNPVFAELSGVGFFIALVLIAVQAVLTRRGGRGRSL